MNPIDFSVLLRGDNPQLIAKGLATTFELTAAAWLLAVVLGTLLALLRMAPNRAAQGFVAGYVEYHQSVPMLVQLFLWYFGIPTLLPGDWQQWINRQGSEFFFAFLAIALAMAAYMSEGLRGGIRSIPQSQLEAARALGLTYLQSLRQVVLPQAVRIALPTFVNHTVLLFKNSSLAMAVGVAELTYVTRDIESQSFRTVEVYLFTTLVYLGFSFLIMAGGSLAERRLRIPTR